MFPKNYILGKHPHSQNIRTCYLHYWSSNLALPTSESARMSSKLSGVGTARATAGETPEIGIVIVISIIIIIISIRISILIMLGIIVIIRSENSKSIIRRSTWDHHQQKIPSITIIIEEPHHPCLSKFLLVAVLKVSGM